MWIKDDSCSQAYNRGQLFTSESVMNLFLSLAMHGPNVHGFCLASRWCVLELAIIALSATPNINGRMGRKEVSC